MREVPANRGLLALSLTLIGFAGAQILMFGFGRDQGIYAMVGHAIVAGGMPYRDAWDFKPPGIFYIYALAEFLFGHRMVGPRILEVIGLLSLYFPCRTIACEVFDSEAAGLLGWTLVVVTYAAQGIDFWTTAQPESFGAMLTIWAIALTVDSKPRFGPRTAAAMVGFLFGLCFLLKPTLAGPALPCAGYLGWRDYHALNPRKGLRTIAIVIVASLIPIAVCVGWFLMRGGFEDLRFALLKFAPAYTAVSLSEPKVQLLGREILAFRPRWLVLIAALLLIWRRDLSASGVYLLLGSLVMEAVGVFIQGKLFGYHYTPVLLIIAVLGGGGLGKLWDRFAGTRTLAIAVTAAVVFSLAALYRDYSGGANRAAQNFWVRGSMRTRDAIAMLTRSRNTDQSLELNTSMESSLARNEAVAAKVDQLSAPTDTIYIWGFEPVVYWLANRSPASRFIYNVPQRAAISAQMSREELMAALQRSRPALMIIESGDSIPVVTGNSADSFEALAGFSGLKSFLVSNYVPADQFGNLQLFVRRQSTSP